MRVAPYGSSSRSWANYLASGALLATPAVILAATASHHDSPLPLAIGAFIAAGFGVLLGREPEVWRPPASGVVMLIYLASLAGLWATTHSTSDGLIQFARGLLLIVAVGLFVNHDLTRSGLAARRKARILCKKLTQRVHWPEDYDLYVGLPEVRNLRETLREDPSPALAMLVHPRTEVRAAAFVALQGRPSWRTVEAAAVIAAARQAHDPPVRAAAVTALATADDPVTIAEIGMLLRDPAPVVRVAAADAILSGGARRWPEVRGYVRDSLADPLLANDGPFPNAAGRLPSIAACDLYTWAAESPPLGDRAASTLVEHYAARLHTGDSPELPSELGELTTDAQTPAALRVELAALLRDFGLVTPEQLDRMTDVDQPGPVRLLAAEVLLAANPDHPDALDVLRGLGRQPNRDTALVIARILQLYLRLDMGLPEDGKVAPASKVAAEAAKRVLMWATGGKPGILGEVGIRSTRPLSAPTLSGLQGNSNPPRKPDRGSNDNLWSPR